MDKNDKLLKEGPKICPYSASSCKGHEVMKRLKVLRQNVKGSIYYNCYANVCFRFPNGRRLRRMLREKITNTGVSLSQKVTCFQKKRDYWIKLAGLDFTIGVVEYVQNFMIYHKNSIKNFIPLTTKM